MRRLTYACSLFAFIATPAAALAQDAATRSVDDYLCTFAGKCGDDAAPVETKDAPATKGFSLARPAARAPGATKKSPETKGFSLATPAAKRVQTPVATRQAASVVAPRAPRKATVARAVAAPKATTATTGKRADLRLSFELGSDQLTEQAREEAKVFAKSLLTPELSGMRFQIEGHTDRAGSRAFNLQLSARRARAVADYLISLGVSPDRLLVKGYGFDRPLEGQSATSHENRRVEAMLLS